MCENNETCPNCGYELNRIEDEYPLPQICCTCSKWSPKKDSNEHGQCSEIGSGITPFDESCASWDNCETANKKG